MVLHLRLLEVLVLVRVGGLELAGVVAPWRPRRRARRRRRGTRGGPRRSRPRRRRRRASRPRTSARQGLGAGAPTPRSSWPAEPLPESLTISSRSGSTRPRNRRSSSVSSASSPSVSAVAKSFGSIANSPGVSRLSPAGAPSPVPLSYFLSKSRTGRNDGSPATARRPAGPPRTCPRRVWSSVDRRDRVAERLQLVGVDQLVVVEVEAVERRDGRGQLGLGERAVLVAVEVVEQGVVALDRPARPTWTRNGPEGGPEDLGQLVERDLAVLRVGVEVGAGQRRRTAGRGPHHRRQRAAVGLLLGQGAVAVAVEVGVDGFRPRRARPRGTPCRPRPTAAG